MEALTFEESRSASISVTDTVGVEDARRLVRSFCLDVGMSRLRAEELVLATSEIATNLVRHSTEGGTITCRLLSHNRGVEVESLDSGPGIPDIDEAMKAGFSTSERRSLGSGLSSARDLVDEFEIQSAPGATRIRMRKWLN